MAIVDEDLERLRATVSIADVIQSLRTSEAVVRISSTESARLRVTPYRTSAHSIRGAVLTFSKTDDAGVRRGEDND